MHFPPHRQRPIRRKTARRGALTVLAAFLLVVMLALMALAIDVGHMCLVRTQAQRAADASALAAAWELIGEERLRGQFDDADASARRVAAEYAARNRLGAQTAHLVTDEDVQIGRLNNFADHSEKMSYGDPRRSNALTVNVLATAARGRQTRHFFAPIFGHDYFDTRATATAAFGNRISGFRTSEQNPLTTLLPFTLKVTDWKAHLNGTASATDVWSYDPVDGSVAPGGDGIPELMLYPIDSTSGNWGTVDIGNDNNSTADLERQIRHGVSDADLARFGGALELDSLTNTLNLNADTGISAGMKDALAEIIGQPRSIPLYRSVVGNGNTTNYEIVGFAGIRIVDVKLTGKDKHLMIQPAFVLDRTAIHETWAIQSDFVVQPVRLVR
jgi:Flp pilus assembly protein TadG